MQPLRLVLSASLWALAAAGPIKHVVHIVGDDVGYNDLGFTVK